MLCSETLLEVRRTEVRLQDTYTPNRAARHTESEGIKTDNARHMPTNKQLARKYWDYTKRVLKKNTNRAKEGLYIPYF